MICTPGSRAALRPLLLLSVLALAASLTTSCGRQLPGAPQIASLSESSDHAWLESTSRPEEVVITLAEGTDATGFGAEYGALLIRVNGAGCAKYRPSPGESAASLALRMAGDPRSVTSEPNAFIETTESRQQSFSFDDGLGSTLTYLDQPAATTLGLESAHVATRGAGILIAILDTGAELSHPALSGHIAGGWDFVSGDADPQEEVDGLDNDGDGRIDEAHGHGTHVAGIAARTAPDARLLIVRVLGADGRGDVMSVSSGIQYALDQGARVINMSLGMLTTSGAIQRLVAEAEARGVVCVASAGNWGAEDPMEYPARSEHVAAVGAVDAAGAAAAFTSYGSFVDLCAPGVSVRSAYHGGRWALWSGTSMSAPFVAGASALLLAVHPDWNRQQVLARLGSAATAIDVSANPGMYGKLGAGALDIRGALLPDFPDLPGNSPPAEEDPILLQR